jgi:3-methyladenine DNA glycosylase/8-oxoguanine DNA glycosylase
MNLKTPPDFAFVPAVCSYGYFLLAPNHWNGHKKTYHTVLTVPDGRAWAVTIDAPKPDAVRVRTPKGKPTAADNKHLRAQVRRILRLDEDLSPFHDFCRQHASHAPAANDRFGRLIRSASLFEDLVKTISTCNITWKQTVGIIAALVEHYGDTAENDADRKGFPRAESLARARLADLKNKCKLGYRAPYVHELARAVADGRFDLDDNLAAELSSDELYKRLRAIKGVGDYAAGNMLMLLGHYDRVAIDSEMIRHYTTRYPRRKATPANIRKHYAAYAPFAFLAYWYELWSAYVAIHGHPNEWPESTGTQITGG